MTGDRRAPHARGQGDLLRRELVDAAAALLARPRGVPAPSLRAVARAVGVSPAAVYLHFASQADLVWAVLERHLDDLATVLSAADDAALDPRRRMHHGAEAYVAWALERPGAYQLLFESIDSLGLDGGQDLPGNRLVEETAQVLVDGGVHVDAARRVATRVWVALHGLVSLRLHKPNQSWPSTLERDRRALVDALLDTVLGPEGRPGSAPPTGS